MLISFALIFLVGMAFAGLFRYFKLPRVLGMLAAGILLGPAILNWLDPTVLDGSGQLCQMSLVILLLKAGLTLNLSELKRVGRPAVMMGFVPAAFEIFSFILFAPCIFHISIWEAVLMGSVIAAVSPALVMPKAVELLEAGKGTEKGVPQILMAGASLDNITVMVLFTSFLGMAQGNVDQLKIFTDIPVSVAAGILAGCCAGWGMGWLFRRFQKKSVSGGKGMFLILLLGTAFLLYALQELLKEMIPVSGILAVVSMACVIKQNCDAGMCSLLTKALGEIWIGAEIVLFVLVGTAADIRYAAEAGPAAVGMIFLALVFRSAGVWLCMMKTALNKKERLFCVISYLPKATVQAAIGTIPLSMGIPCGKIISVTAILVIVITAPLGAIGMEAGERKLLSEKISYTEGQEQRLFL